MKKKSFGKEDLMDGLESIAIGVDKLLSKNEKQLVLEVGNKITKMGVKVSEFNTFYK